MTGSQDKPLRVGWCRTRKGRGQGWGQGAYKRCRKPAYAHNPRGEPTCPECMKKYWPDRCL